MDDFDLILSRVPEAKRAALTAWWASVPQEHRARGLQDLARLYPAPQAPPVPMPTRELPTAVRDATRAVPQRPRSAPAPTNLPPSIGPALARTLPAPKPWTAAQMLAQGYTLGGADELRATEHALLGGTNYQDELAREQRAYADYLTQNPIQGRVLELGGNVLSALGPLELALGKKLIGAAPGMIRRLAVPTAIGAGTGAAVGALSAPEGQRAEGAALGGVMGAPTGFLTGLLPSALRGARGLMGGVPTDAAERILLSDLAASGRSLDDASAYLRAAGPNEPVSLGEAIAPGPRSPTSRTQRAAYQVPGTGQAATARGLGAVEGDVLASTGREVSDVSGVGRTNITSRLDEMRQSIAETGEQMYGPALDRRGIVSDPKVNAVVNNPYVQKYAIPQANKILEARGLPVFPERGAPSARQLQYLKGALDDLIDYSGPQGMGGLSRTEQAAVKDLRRSLNSAMEEAIPGYAEANARIAPLIRQRERFADAADFAKMSADDFEVQWQGWSQGEREAFRESAINHALAEMETAGQVAGMDKVSGLRNRFTSTSDRRKWRMILGRDASQVQGYIERALNRSSRNRDIMGGSSTASNQAGLGVLADEAGAASAAGNLARGNLFGAAGDVISLGTNRMRGITPKTAEQIQALYNLGIETSPNLAGQANRQAVEEGLRRMGLASERQGRGLGRQTVAAARLSAILAQLMGGQMTEEAYRDRP